MPTLEDAYFVLMHRKPNGNGTSDLAIPTGASVPGVVANASDSASEVRR